MIVRIFSSGTSNGQSVVNYLLDDTNHEGNKRAVAPEILAGSPAATINIINAIDRKWKYVSGAIAFRDGAESDNLSRSQMHAVIKKFKHTFCAGLKDSQFNSLFVLHKDKGNVEIHFVIPMIAFSDSNSIGSGKRMNIHVPGKRNIALYDAFTKVMNHEMGFDQVQFEAFKLGVPSHKLKSPECKADNRKSLNLQQIIVQQIQKGIIKDRNQLCQWMVRDLGITITRQGQEYISIKLPGDKKARRLRGPMFQETANYSDMLIASRKSSVHVKLTSTEYEFQNNRLQTLVEERRAFNQSIFSSSRPVRFGGVKMIKPRQPISMGNPITTIIKEVGDMKNFDVVKKIINDALSAILLGKQEKAATLKAPSINSIKERKEVMRSNAFPSIFNETSRLISELEITLGEVNLAIQEAMGMIQKARTRPESLKAEQRLRELIEQKKRIGAQIKHMNTQPSLVGMK